MERPGQPDLRAVRRRRCGLPARGRALRCDRGSALVELALVVGILGVPLVLGTAQIGSLVYDSIEISNAASAGALYGMQSSTFAADNTGMIAAAQAEAADFGAKLSATPTAFYVCALAVGGTRYIGANAATNAAAACTGASNHALEFVQVNTSAMITPVIHLPVLPQTFTVSGSAAMEVEQ